MIDGDEKLAATTARRALALRVINDACGRVADSPDAHAIMASESHATSRDNLARAKT